MQAIAVIAVGVLAVLLPTNWLLIFALSFALLIALDC
jgi:hypothetical protein